MPARADPAVSLVPQEISIACHSSAPNEAELACESDFS